MTSDSPKSSFMISVSPKKLKCFLIPSILYGVVQSLSRVWLFVTPWTAACHASLYFNVSQSLLKLVSIEAMMPSNHLVTPFSSCPQSFPTSSSFLMSQLVTSGGQSIEASASASGRPMNSQDWFPLGLIGLISLLSKGFWRVFFKASIFRHSAFFMVQLTSIHDYIALSRRTFVGKVMSLLLICCLGLSWLFF